MVMKPGVRKNRNGGITIQYSKRSEQLEGIADSVEQFLKKCVDGSEKIDATEVHRLRGYMEQLRIISDELKGVKS